MQKYETEKENQCKKPLKKAQCLPRLSFQTRNMIYKTDIIPSRKTHGANFPTNGKKKENASGDKSS